MKPIRLGVNIDHVATLRNARGGAHPCPVRAAERAAQAGGARRRPRRDPAAAVDPALTGRARAAAERLTGLPTRIAAGRLEIRFENETRLAELVETLEAL